MRSARSLEIDTFRLPVTGLLKKLLGPFFWAIWGVLVLGLTGDYIYGSTLFVSISLLF